MMMVHLVLALTCFASAFSTSRAATPLPPRPMMELHHHQRQGSLLSDSKRQQSLQHLSNHGHRPHHQHHTTTVFLSSTSETDPNVTLSSVEVITDEASASSTSSSSSSAGYSRQNRRLQIALVFCGAIGALGAAAKTGLLVGYTSDAMIYRDIGATSLAAVLAVVLVKAITYGHERGMYSSKVGRKLNHTLAAPLFMLFFPLFSAADGARFFAGLVTLSNILRLYLAGKGLAEESSLASVVSRSGNKAEALGGPFIYVCLFQCFIWLFWRSSPVGVVGMSVMAAGDGMADLIGRRWGGNSQWQVILNQLGSTANSSTSEPKAKENNNILAGFGENKSVVGTVAFAVSAFVVTFALVQWLSLTGCMELPSSLGTMDVALRILLISSITAVVELLPVGDDNYTVPLTAAGMAALLLQ